MRCVTSSIVDTYGKCMDKDARTSDQVIQSATQLFSKELGAATLHEFAVVYRVSGRGPTKKNYLHKNLVLSPCLGSLQILPTMRSSRTGIPS
jgi:hypothetical protein